MVNKKTLIIAGPCAVEEKAQFDKIVQEIYQYTDVIRAGIWKARTSPVDYPGVGERGLPWAKEVQKKYKTPVAIEIGTTKHLELALQYELRVFWIGARTTVNPFAIQDLADAMKGLDIELWVKNPLVADLKLWSGAIDRFKKNGLNNIKAIHRGFHTEKNIIYRNNPRWELLEKFRTHHPDIPVICDPSHISGNHKYIYQIAQKAIDKKLDGLMIEVHNLPEKALSDRIQQLSPSNFNNLLKKLKYPT